MWRVIVVFVLWAGATAASAQVPEELDGEEFDSDSRQHSLLLTLGGSLWL